MASLLVLQILIFSLFSLPIFSALPFLLSLNCNLTEDHFNSSFIQCRPDLTPNQCTLCVENAKQSISNLCPNAQSFRAWFDGCYIQYYNNYNYRKLSHPHSETTNLFCSNQTNILDLAQFEIALEISLLRLRARIYMATHRGFSHVELQYGNESRIYAMAECVRYVSSMDCETCVGKGIDKLYENCGGKAGGTVVSGYCIVRYENYPFFSNLQEAAYGLEWNSSGGNGISGDMSIWENGKECCLGWKVKVVFVWGIGVACFVLVVFSAWLLRRSIVNKAKVGIFGSWNDNQNDT
ncbi:cysteine-rich repeat secretory protein 38-like [Quillaja saponaria]|uniref:Cysteine-rich repeat secretory protein 38-like n=1 Tax=Quillaja saponaria TaxID=32244 RepID=A0AAD7L9M8_QUISA|nr:cysteine-rich repeat secretory protein 38-like [Quillaja saponaria]